MKNSSARSHAASGVQKHGEVERMNDIFPGAGPILKINPMERNAAMIRRTR
jgi:hypothetical protein